jgi:hypothetical protein
LFQIFFFFFVFYFHTFSFSWQFLVGGFISFQRIFIFYPLIY